MIKRGPRNIDLHSIAKYRFPLPALVSILHRISGVILFLLIPFGLWMLHLSLTSQVSFLTVKDYMGSPVAAFFTWMLLSAFFYHLLAGIKHILMDMGFLEELHSSRIASVIVFALGIIGAVGIGVWILW